MMSLEHWLTCCDTSRAQSSRMRETTAWLWLWGMEQGHWGDLQKIFMPQDCPARTTDVRVQGFLHHYKNSTNDSTIYHLCAEAHWLCHVCMWMNDLLPVSYDKDISYLKIKIFKLNILTFSKCMSIIDIVISLYWTVLQSPKKDTSTSRFKQWNVQESVQGLCA